MAKKLNAEISARLKNMGIKVKSEEDARKQLLKILADNDIDGMEEEDTESLLDMAESMIDIDEEPEVEDEAEDEVDDEVDDTDEEPEVDDEVESTPEVSEEDELDDLVEEVKKEDKKQAKKTKKVAEKKVVKVEKKSGKYKLDPCNNEADRKEFEWLHKYFPTDKYFYNWLVTNGVTVKYQGNNSMRAVVLLENCVKKGDELICNFYMLTFTKNLGYLDERGIDYKTCWNGAPFISKISFTEVEDIIKQLFDEMNAFVGKIDKRMGDNRKKMESNLDKFEKKAKTATKTAKKEVEPEVEEEVAETKPKAAKKTAKKTTKKTKK